MQRTSMCPNRARDCISYIQSNCPFVEFVREVTDMQVSQVAPVILPEMYKIFSQAEVC